MQYLQFSTIQYNATQHNVYPYLHHLLLTGSYISPHVLTTLGVHVAAFVSNCKKAGAGKRFEYLRELGQYISVSARQSPLSRHPVILAT